MSVLQAISNPPSAGSEIEALLLEHPDVLDVSLVDEEGPDGRFYPVAYVVPHPERMKEARERIYRTDRGKRIAQWKKTFDQVYRFGPGNHGPTFAGWTSSYTNKPIPRSEMQEWLDCTIDRIASLKPDKVLEIGCGVGLLLEHLAPQCSTYHGTDFSAIAVARLREFTASKPELSHVELFEREATKLDDHAPGCVDTVVINSVTQYFPDIAYLRAVLEGAVRVVGAGGRIFIGDVRHLGLLAVFHGAVQLAKAPPTATVRWLKRKISLAVAHERELVIDPQFFLELPGSIPRICGVEILLKRGRAHNELTRYRYDVVLYVGEANVDPLRQETEQAGDPAETRFASRFDAQRLASVNILSVPNRRLAADLEDVRRLRSADERDLVDDIKRSRGEHIETGCDPEDFCKLADMAACDVRVGWAAHSTEGHFDVAFVARDRSRPRLELGPLLIDRLAASQPTNVSHRRRLATDPLSVTFMQQLGLELGQLLSDRLPAAQLPATVLAVHKLPSGDASDASRPSRSRLPAGSRQTVTG